MPFEADFASLEGLLAAINYIANDKRTAFQARLKNFHRLGFPSDLQKVKGRPTRYSVGQIYEMALAVECTQLGLSPERTIQILRDSRFALAYAAGAAVATLEKHPDGFPDPDPETGRLEGDVPTGHFLMFDPFALRSLTSEQFAERHDWFAYVIEHDLDKTMTFATGGGTSRVAAINITALIDRFALPGREWREERTLLLKELLEWAEMVAQDIVEKNPDGNP